MHTHFGSGTHIVGTFLGVLIIGTAWRIGWLHGLTAKNRHVRGFARMALTQY
jgi:cell division protein FtsX